MLEGLFIFQLVLCLKLYIWLDTFLINTLTVSSKGAHWTFSPQGPLVGYSNPGSLLV